MEKFRHKAPGIFTSTGVFGFIFYIGLRLASGEKLGGSKGIVRMATDALNGLSDHFGPAVAGSTLMGLATVGGIWAAVHIWRDPLW